MYSNIGEWRPRNPGKNQTHQGNKLYIDPWLGNYGILYEGFTQVENSNIKGTFPSITIKEERKVGFRRHHLKEPIFKKKKLIGTLVRHEESFLKMITQ